MLKRNRIIGIVLVCTILAIPAIMAYQPSSSVAASLDTNGRNFWGGVVCGLALGSAIVGGAALIAGTGGFGAAVAFSAGLHVMAVCAFL